MAGDMTSYPTLTMKQSAEKSVQRRHPWLFSNAVDRVKGAPRSGETVRVVTGKNEFCGFGAYSPSSQIRVRFLSFDPAEMITPEFFRKKLFQAIKKRGPLLSSPLPSVRIVNGESDGLPGLIVDRYADFLVCQFLSAGPEANKTEIVSCLAELCPVAGIYERSDSDVREKEGLPQTKGLLWGKEPGELIQIQEGELSFLVNVKTGHKTGFYLDQRDNRKRVSEYVKEKKVLNCFSYTGGFSLFALQGGAAHVTSIDSSEEAVSMIEKNAALNQMPSSRMTTLQEDVFLALRKFRDRNERFDVIVLDPPKFASSGQMVQKAARGYKDINLLALKLLNEGGYLFTFSCSGHIPRSLFQKIVSDAALDAGRAAQITGHMTQAEDHPVSLNFPEGLYLKGLVIRVE